MIENKFGKFKKGILKEIKKTAYSESSMPEEDWDLVWVLSGPEEDIQEVPVQGKRNETKDRLITALKIVRQITALRMAKKIKDINIKDILSWGPAVYYNGTDLQNDNLRNIVEKFSEQQDFPKEKIIISENLGIKHTGDQFTKFPDEILKDKRKIILISDVYHLPRVKRYIRMEAKFDPQEIILYPSEPKKAPVKKVLKEIRKISRYIKEGILPPEDLP